MQQRSMNSPNVLIVDDEVGPRESLKMILKTSFNTYTAEDGRSALEITKNISIDLVTLDLKMPGIKYHHERFDGKGYPEGLSGKGIPLFTRIIAIADSYDAMIVGRPYKERLSKDDALLELKKSPGSQFDRELVDVFLREMKKNDRGIDSMHSMQ